MIIVGIIGGVASGKSTIAQQFASLGAIVFNGDRIGHDVLSEPEVIEVAQERWGSEVVDAEGQLIRAAIAARVFGEDPASVAELEFWESQTHPRITALVAAELERLEERQKSEGTKRVVILDAAVLLKAGWGRWCDHLLFVDSPYENRLARATRRGWSTQHFAAREAAQLSLQEKKEKATGVIDNSGTLEQTYSQVLDFWNSLSVRDSAG